MSDEQKLLEVEDLLRNIPIEFGNPNDKHFSWVGRVKSIVNNHSLALSVGFNLITDNLFSNYPLVRSDSLNKVRVALHQVRSDLKMKLVGHLSVAIGRGMKFDYFDELRKKIELGSREVFFVDQFLDAGFVSNYLVHVKENVKVKLLVGETPNATLLPAAKMLSEQENINIEIRSSFEKIHDRYLIVDMNDCYQSGASFKDGGKNSPTTITQITDASSAVIKIYEDFWNSGNKLM